MKKLICSLLILLLLSIVILLFIIPYGLGFLLQEKYNHIITELNKTGAVQVTLVHYQRGWFNSTATLKITIIEPALQTNPRMLGLNASYLPAQTYTLHQQIQHGFIVNGGKQLLFGQGLIHTDIVSASTKLIATTFIKYNGSLLSIFQVPYWVYQNTTDQTYIQIKALTGQIKISNDLKKILINNYAAHIQIQINTAIITIEKAKFQGNLTQANSGLWLGNHRFIAEELSMNTPFRDQKISLSALHLQCDDQQIKDRINTKIQIGLANIIAQNRSYGPQSLALNLYDLEAKSVLNLIKATDALANHLLSTQTVTHYQSLLTTLFNQGLTIDLQRLQLVTPWGDLVFSMQMHFPQQATPNNLNTLFLQADGITNINASTTLWMQMIEVIHALSYNRLIATADISTNTCHMKTSLSNFQTIASEQMSQWVNQAWLIPTQLGYKTQIMYQNQQLRINGKPFDSYFQ